jgi:hypothetical protein
MSNVVCFFLFFSQTVNMAVVMSEERENLLSYNHCRSRGSGVVNQTADHIGIFSAKDV